MTEEKIRPMGNLRIVDKRGYCYLPTILRKELAVEGKGFDVPFYINANCVLLLRKGATVKNVLDGLDVLKKDIELRSGEVTK
jgi:hypothetical protein